MEARASGKRPQVVKEKWARYCGDNRGAGHVGTAMELERGLLKEQGMGQRTREETFRWIVVPGGLLEGARVYMDGSMYD